MFKKYSNLKIDLNSSEQKIQSKKKIPCQIFDFTKMKESQEDHKDDIFFNHTTNIETKKQSSTDDSEDGDEEKSLQEDTNKNKKGVKKTESDYMHDENKHIKL